MKKSFIYRVKSMAKEIKVFTKEIVEPIDQDYLDDTSKAMLERSLNLANEAADLYAEMAIMIKENNRLLKQIAEANGAIANR